MHISICKWCNNKFNLSYRPKGWMANHVRWCEKNPNLENYKNQLRESAKNATSESAKNKMSESTKKTWIDGKYENAKMRSWSEGSHLPDETRRKISVALKKAHAEGRHSGWTHINSDEKMQSYPERLFEKILIENGLYDKYTIKNHLPFGKYFLDFAIVDLKCDVEIDGSCHFINDDAIKHDLVRNEFVISKGWRVYRISAALLIKNPEEELNKFLSFMNNKKEYVTYDAKEVLRIMKPQEPKYGKRADYIRAVLEVNNVKNKDKIEELLESNIDFGKFGWVNKASDVIGIKPQKVSKWMKRNLPEFYSEKCYIRKGPCSSTD